MTTHRYPSLFRSSTNCLGACWTQSTTTRVCVVDDHAVKKSIFGPRVFWFMVCSQYFPKWLLNRGAAKDHIDKMTKALNDQFSAIVLPFKPTCPNLPIIDRRKNNPIWSIAPVVFDVYYQKEWDFAVDLRFANLRSECIGVVRKEQLRVAQHDQMDGYETTKKTSVDSLIAALTKEYEELNEMNSKALAKIDKRISEAISEEKLAQSKSTTDEITCDLHSVCEAEKKFIKTLEDTRFKKRAEPRKRSESTNRFLEQLKAANSKVISNELYVCQICNGGDTHEQNSIVFCARCSVTVHQRCYRLDELPNQDWICNLCLAFQAKGRHLRCLTCTRRGGVMLETDCVASSDFVKSVNPDMHVPKNKKASKRKRQGETAEAEASPEDGEELAKEADRERYKEFYQNLYYNHFREPPEYTSSLESADPNIKKLEPVPSRFWVHSSCAYWLPGLELDPESKLITGVEQVDMRRFRMRCSICGQGRSGLPSRRRLRAVPCSRLSQTLPSRVRSTLQTADGVRTPGSSVLENILRAACRHRNHQASPRATKTLLRAHRQIREAAEQATRVDQWGHCRSHTRPARGPQSQLQSERFSHPRGGQQRQDH